MDKFARQYTKEYIRMAMLKQEEIFREQVIELHRLYRVQILMMEEITNFARSNAQGRSCDCIRPRVPRSQLDLELPGGDYGNESEDAVKLTLATRGNWGEIEGAQIKPRLGASFLSSTNEHGDMSTTAMPLNTTSWNENSSSYSTIEKGGGFNFEEAMVRERLKQQPPSWHFQCLSLNTSYNMV